MAQSGATKQINLEHEENDQKGLINNQANNNKINIEFLRLHFSMTFSVLVCFVLMFSLVCLWRALKKDKEEEQLRN